MSVIHVKYIDNRDGDYLGFETSSSNYSIPRIGETISVSSPETTIIGKVNDIRNTTTLRKGEFIRQDIIIFVG